MGRRIWRNDSLSYIPGTGNEYEPIEFGWTRINQSDIGFDVTQPKISALAMSADNSDLLYYGTSSGRIYRLENCKSEVPEKIDIRGDLASGYVSSLSVNPLDADEVMVTFSSYNAISVYHSADGGENWVNVSGNLEENPDGSGDGPSVTWGDIYQGADSSNYYIGTSIGLYSTKELDGESTIWKQEGAESIGNLVINMVRSRNSDGIVAVATHGGGVFSARQNSFSAIEESVRSNLTISANPNPFTDDITLFIEAPQAGECQLSLIDMSGKSISMKLDRRLRQGLNELKWDLPANLSSGVYLLNLNSNGYSKSLKLIRR